MPDAALSVASSSMAGTLTVPHADSGAKTHATTQKAAPFAALMAGATHTKAAQETDKPHVADPVAVRPADKPAVASAPPAAAAAATSAERPSASDAVTADPDTARAAPHDKSDDSDDEDKDDRDDGTDHLADAIASGATAVLALAPAIVAPVQPQPPVPTPVRIDAPVTVKPLKLGSAPGLPTHPPLKVTTDILDTPVPTQATDAVAPAETAEGPAPKVAVPTQNQLASLATPTEPRLKSDAPAGTVDADKPMPPAVQGAPQDQPSTNAAQAGTDTPPAQQQSQADQRQQQTPQATGAAPAATQLPPEVAKAVAAALAQGDGASAVAAADPANPMTISAAATAQPQLPQQRAEPAAPTAKQTALAEQPIVATASHTQTASRSDEAPAPRRAGVTRKRTDPLPSETASIDATPRAADTARPTASLAAGDAQAKGDAIVQQTLSIARDGAWLDKLAHDIASAGNGSDLHFKLDPQNLGALSVAISQGADGASIRLTADNSKTRDILVDAQPKLIAEAHAQGLKIADTQVDVRQDQNRSQNQNHNQDAQRWAQNGAGQNNSSQNGQNRQSSPGHQPFVSNLRRKAESESESPDRDSDVLYA